MDATVDVILPTYCRPHTLGYALRSVLRQTHTDLQLHIICDGCDGATEALVRTVDDERLHFYRFPKAAGYGYVHRNHVLRRTAAPFVAYATDDDLWFPDHLERALTALQQRQLGPAASVLSAGPLPARTPEVSGGRVGSLPAAKSDRLLGLVALRSCPIHVPDLIDPFFFAFDWQNRFATTVLRNWFMGALNCVHRRDVFERVGYWNDRLDRFGDRDFYNRVRLSDVPSAYVDDVTILRFYALHWDGQYAALKEPPQRKYLELLRDPQWCAALRQCATQPQRSLAVRRRQWRDFMRFAARSGPKFLRFWWQRLRSGSPRGQESLIEPE